MGSPGPHAPTRDDARFAPQLRVAAFVLAALVLGLLVLAGALWLESRRLTPPRDYFPEGVLDPADEMRFGRLLAEMGEPVLAASGDDGQFALRMLYDPSWGDPLAVRYQATGGQGLRRQIVLDDPADDRADRRIAVVRESAVSADELNALRQRLEQQGFWALPPGEEVFGKDGYLLLVEAVDGDRHQLLVRWTPDSQATERGLGGLVALMSEEFNRDGMRVFVEDMDGRSP